MVLNMADFRKCRQSFVNLVPFSPLPSRAWGSASARDWSNLHELTGRWWQEHLHFSSRDGLNILIAGLFSKLIFSHSNGRLFSTRLTFSKKKCCHRDPGRWYGHLWRGIWWTTRIVCADWDIGRLSFAETPVIDAHRVRWSSDVVARRRISDLLCGITWICVSCVACFKICVSLSGWPGMSLLPLQASVNR